MKKLVLLAAALGLAAAAHAAPAQPLPAGINAVGWDNELGQITARIGLSENNAVDLGFGMGYNTPDVGADEFAMGLSGYYLLKLQDWGVVDNYLVGGANAVITDELGLTLFAGLQPEVTLLDRLIVSIRFGLSAGVTPEFSMETAGDPLSIVTGAKFKVIW